MDMKIAVITRLFDEKICVNGFMIVKVRERQLGQKRPQNAVDFSAICFITTPVGGVKCGIELVRDVLLKLLLAPGHRFSV